MAHNRVLHRLTTALLAALLTLAIAIPAFAGPPTDFVKGKSDRLFNIINQPVGKERTESLKTEVRTLVDYNELAGRALGEHWTKRSDAEKQEFIALLEELVEVNYANRFKSHSKELSYKVNYVDEKIREKTGQAIVKTRVDYGKEATSLDYKLLQRGADTTTFTIYDIVFDDISLEETYRESYVPIIAKEGWASLIKRMKDRLAELKKG